MSLRRMLALLLGFVAAVIVLALARAAGLSDPVALATAAGGAGFVMTWISKGRSPS